MRPMVAALGVVIGVVSLGAILAGLPTASAQRTPPAATSDRAVVAFPLSSDANASLVAVIDPSQRRMAVYQVQAGTGQITLKSVRDLTWDLSMEQFNVGAPTPDEIRAMLPR